MLKILKTIARFFTIEPARKILALILAFGLWIFVAIDGTYNYDKEIVVSYTNLPDAYIITDSVVKLKVSFNGKGKTLMGIWSSSPKALCNLSEVVPGKNVISTKDCVVPVKDVVINYGTKYINVEIDEKITKPIKPSISVKGGLKNGFSISAIEILDTISITGPKKILQRLNEVNTESLDVKNQSSTFEKKLKIESVSGQIKFSKDNITVKVVIDSSSQGVFTDLVINIVKNSGQGVRILTPSIDTLIVSGAQSRINNLHKEELVVRLKTTDLVPGEYYLSPEIVLPDFLIPVYIKPQRLKVLVY